MPKLSKTTQASSRYTSRSGSGSRTQLPSVVLSVVKLSVVGLSVVGLSVGVLKIVVNVVARGVELYVVVLGVTSWGFGVMYLCTSSSSSSYVLFKQSRISISIGHISSVVLGGDVSGEVSREVSRVVTVEVCVEVSGVDVGVDIGVDVGSVIRVLSGVSVVEKHLGIIFFSLFGTG